MSLSGYLRTEVSRVWLSWAGAGAASLVLPCWGVEDRKAAPVTTTHNYNPTLTLIICVDCTIVLALPQHSILCHIHMYFIILGDTVVIDRYIFIFLMLT